MSRCDALKDEIEARGEGKLAVCPVLPKGRVEAVMANCQFALPFSGE
jgi:hypothetical protein